MSLVHNFDIRRHTETFHRHIGSCRKKYCSRTYYKTLIRPLIFDCSSALLSLARELRMCVFIPSTLFCVDNESQSVLRIQLLISWHRVERDWCLETSFLKKSSYICAWRFASSIFGSSAVSMFFWLGREDAGFLRGEECLGSLSFENVRAPVYVLIASTKKLVSTKRGTTIDHT